jgi:hypothetical protein
VRPQRWKCHFSVPKLKTISFSIHSDLPNLESVAPPTFWDGLTPLRMLSVQWLINSGGARPRNLGGGAFEGQTHILGGQDRIFKKVLLFAHAVVTGLLSPPGDSPPSQIPPPADEYPRNIAPPPEGGMPQEYRPPL